MAVKGGCSVGSAGSSAATVHQSRGVSEQAAAWWRIRWPPPGLPLREQVEMNEGVYLGTCEVAGVGASPPYVLRRARDSEEHDDGTVHAHQVSVIQNPYLATQPSSVNCGDLVDHETAGGIQAIRG